MAIRAAVRLPVRAGGAEVTSRGFPAKVRQEAEKLLDCEQYDNDDVMAALGRQVVDQYIGLKQKDGQAFGGPAREGAA